MNEAQTMMRDYLDALFAIQHTYEHVLKKDFHGKYGLDFALPAY